jgi:hypothetical protein
MPYVTKPMNAMGGEYVESFGTNSSINIWLSNNIVGVGTSNYTAHPLGLGVPNAVAIPTGCAAVWAGTVVTSVSGSIGVTATTGGTYKILVLM